MITPLLSDATTSAFITNLEDIKRYINIYYTVGSWNFEGGENNYNVEIVASRPCTIDDFSHSDEF